MVDDKKLQQDIDQAMTQLQTIADQIQRARKVITQLEQEYLKHVGKIEVLQTYLPKKEKKNDSKDSEVSSSTK